jgi:hypothetical protein
MYTDTQIEVAVKELSLIQVESILSEFYTESGNSEETITMLFANRTELGSLHYDLVEHIKSEQIDIIKVILEQ